MSTDAVYTERAHLVASLTKLFPASVEQHVGEDWDDDWRNVCIIDLPTGQASWHIALKDLHLFAHVPRDAGRSWDGHTVEEKYRRLDALEPHKPFANIFVNVSLANEAGLKAEIQGLIDETLRKAGP